jgi:hypothetical protein
VATLVPKQEEDFLEDEEEDAEVDEMEPWKGGYVKTFGSARVFQIVSRGSIPFER